MTQPPDFNPFSERRRALEEAFFHERDAQLLEKLRGELSSMEEKRKLAHVSGIIEEQVLLDLVKAGVGAETLVAMQLVPMLYVAWADGKMETDERAAILNVASEVGIEPGSATYDLLERWLTTRPDEQIVTAWKQYVSEMARQMPKESLAGIKKTTLDRCHRAAKASGGFLGYGAVSPSEQTAIDSIAHAFEGM